MFDRESEKFNKLVKIYNIHTSLSQESTTGFPQTASHVERWDGIPKVRESERQQQRSRQPLGSFGKQGECKGTGI